PDSENTDVDVQRARKRRRIVQENDIEASYLRNLARAEMREDSQRGTLSSTTVSWSSSRRGGTGESSRPETAEGVEVPPHETLANCDALSDREEAARTIFLGNVSTAAIK